MLNAKRIKSTICPLTILKLNDGTFYYNYDIKSETITVVNTDTEELLQEILYSYILIQLSGTPQYDKCVLAIIRMFITENEEFELINKHAALAINLAENNEKEYELYLALLKEIKYKVKVDFNLVENNPIEEAKNKVIFLINSYDSSSNVNEFSYQGINMWLDKDTRNGLLMRLNAEKLAGKTETTLWYGTLNFTLNIDTLITMINTLEVYASLCFDRTSAHKAAVSQLTNLDDIYNYNYTTGYPSKLVFN